MRVLGKTLAMTRGDSEAIKITLKNSVGVAVPLVDGDTVYFTVKTSTGETEKVMQKVVTSFVDGEAIITIAPADTKSLTVRSYVYDVQVTTSLGNVKTIITPSTFLIESEVTYE